MNEVIKRIKQQFVLLDFDFLQKPIIIGGMAMEYYNIRKSGADIDLVVCNSDYQKLAKLYPEKRKDIYGDFGVVIEPFEIWRSIALLDYDFYKVGTIDEGAVQVVSLDRLLFMRVCAMEVKKYLDDLELMKEHYYKNFRNQDFLREAETHIPSYEENGGIVWSGKYQD